MVYHVLFGSFFVVLFYDVSRLKHNYFAVGINFVDRNSDVNGHSECFSIQNPLDKGSLIKEPFDFRDPYPYVLVNIGSGVSIMLVKSESEYARITGKFDLLI